MGRRCRDFIFLELLIFLMLLKWNINNNLKIAASELRHFTFVIGKFEGMPENCLLNHNRIQSCHDNGINNRELRVAI